MKGLSHFHCLPITNEDLTQDIGTHLYDSFSCFERILEDHQELSKEVLRKFGGGGMLPGAGVIAGISY